MKIKKDDKVKIIAGKDKGKVAKVLRTFRSEGKVLVEGVNVVKKHVKPDGANNEGGIVSFEKPIDISNVMFYSEKEKRPVRLGYKIENKKKVRFSKASGNLVD